jgi:hypothetical protein
MLRKLIEDSGPDLTKSQLEYSNSIVAYIDALYDPIYDHYDIKRIYNNLRNKYKIHRDFISRIEMKSHSRKLDILERFHNDFLILTNIQ